MVIVDPRQPVVDMVNKLRWPKPTCINVLYKPASKALVETSKGKVMSLIERSGIQPLDSSQAIAAHSAVPCLELCIHWPEEFPPKNKILEAGRPAATVWLIFAEISHPGVSWSVDHDTAARQAFPPVGSQLWVFGRPEPTGGGGVPNS